MRVNAGEDRGGIAILFAVVTTTVVMGASALAIDAGHYWKAQRQLVTATDAAALAAAQEYGVGSTGCASGAITYLAMNADATLEECTWVGSSDAGYVSVLAAESVPFVFGALIGVPEGTARSRSTAQVGAPTAVAGLRPLALCMQDAEFQRWRDGGAGPFRIEIDDATLCGGAAGNWGWLDGDGAGGGAAQLRDALRNGLPGEFSVDDTIGVKPGMNVGAKDAMADLVGEEFFVVLYEADPAGCGGNAEYTIAGFAGIRLLDFDLTAEKDGGGPPEDKDKGPPKDKDCGGGDAAAGGYILVDFVGQHTSGACCAGDPTTTNVRVSRICDVSLDGPDPSACTATD